MTYTSEKADHNPWRIKGNICPRQKNPQIWSTDVRDRRGRESPRGLQIRSEPMFDVVCCRKCGPRLSEGAAEKLKNRYVLMRGGAGEHERETGRKTSIPITVRCVP